MRRSQNDDVFIFGGGGYLGARAPEGSVPVGLWGPHQVSLFWGLGCPAKALYCPPPPPSVATPPPPDLHHSRAIERAQRVAMAHRFFELIFFCPACPTDKRPYYFRDQSNAFLRSLQWRDSVGLQTQFAIIENPNRGLGIDSSIIGGAPRAVRKGGCFPPAVAMDPKVLNSAPYTAPAGTPGIFLLV